MGLLRQVRVLTGKDLTIVALRSCIPTALRAIVLPIAYVFFIAYVRNFFLPPSEYGIGSPRPIRNLTTEVFGSSTSLGGRNRVALINNGFAGGQIDNVIQTLADPLREAGADVRVLSAEEDLFDVCQSSLRGLSRCYASAEFHSSPTEGAGIWNYTARTDYGLGFSVFVNRGNNDAQVFVLPFVHAIDAAIAAQSGQTLPETMLEYPFTYETIQDREDEIQGFFMRALVNFLAVTLFIGICGITYHLPGYMATERESGMSQLIDAMLPTTNEWQALTARLLSLYGSFTLVYVAGWVAMGVIVSRLIFYSTATSIVVLFHLLTGLALAGWSIVGGTFFRRAQLSGISVLLTSLILAVLAQFVPRDTATITGLSVVFPPVTYTVFMIQLAQWEQYFQPANLSTYPIGSDFNISGYLFFVFLAAQIVTFPLLAGVLQRLLFGIRSGSCKSLNPADGDLAYSLREMCKYYRPNPIARFLGDKGMVKAVDNLSLDARRGQVLVLLGANGSGKSTTLAAIAGTHSVSRGHIKIDRSSGLGFCPQKNVLWDSLTVMEHVRIFNGLKCTQSPDTQTEIEQLIDACDLKHKLKAKSKTLSGGQKRKLQLAMAFTGGSQICCVDEVSSGLDPLSRKIIWNILLAERGRRTLLLTTHALDEADALADEIAVMSKGRLIAQGSSVELKNAHGGGYRVAVSAADAIPIQLEGVRTTSSEGQTLYQAPDSSKACQVMDEVQRQTNQDLQFNGPTIEDVFLKLAQEYEEELSDFQIPQSTVTLLHDAIDVGGKGRPSADMAYEMLEIARGRGTSFVRQIWILLRKRVIILSRNYLPYCAAVALPVITAGLTTMFLGGFDRLICSLGTLANNPRRISIPALQVFWGLLVPVGPTQRFANSALPPAYVQFVDYLRLQDTYEDFQGFVADNFRTVVPGGFYLGDNATAAPLMAYRINGNLGYSALAKNVVDSYLLNTTIVADFSTFALPFVGSMGDSLQLVLYFGFAMSCFPAFFALYPTFERRGNIRALHYSNGIRPGPLWLAYAVFDSIFVLLVSMLTIILFTSLSSVWFAPGYLFVVFFLYGISSTLLSYIVSLLAKTQLAAFAFIAGGQAVFLLIYFIMYMVLITFAQQDQLFHNLNIVQFTYGLITPSGNLLRALLLALNQSQLLCRNQSFVSYPADITVYGGPILYLILQSIAFYSFLVIHDSGWRPSLAFFNIRRRAARKDVSAVESTETPPEVLKEGLLTETNPAELKVLHLTKSFRHNRVVDDLTFSVPHSQVFALLGPNGAGKSTTISLIRGDVRPSTAESDILIEDHSVRCHRLTTRRLLGVCPQFDTMDRLTVSEHLSFYARVRGVPNVKFNVEKVITAVGLLAYKNRMTAQLSGGNQRKLSLGTAIIGNPSVLLLDEPSSGMDAVSKRIMWKAIEGIKKGRSVVITTHSMEEASALADKAGIMSKRLLAVGTTKELRETHGQGKYHVHLVLKNEADMQKVYDWVIGNIKGADMEGNMLHGQMRFVVSRGHEGVESERISQTGRDKPDTSSAELVGLLKTFERFKDTLGIEYYSVSPTTLEDVFLSIATKARLTDE